MKLFGKILRIATLALVATFLRMPAAHACAVCFDAAPGQRTAYYGTAVLLTLLPLGLLAAGAYWFFGPRRGLKQPSATDSADPPVS